MSATKPVSINDARGSNHSPRRHGYTENSKAFSADFRSVSNFCSLRDKRLKIWITTIHLSCLQGYGAWSASPLLFLNHRGRRGTQRKAKLALGINAVVAE